MQYIDLIIEPGTEPIEDIVNNLKKLKMSLLFNISFE